MLIVRAAKHLCVVCRPHSSAQCTSQQHNRKSGVNAPTHRGQSHAQQPWLNYSQFCIPLSRSCFATNFHSSQKNFAKFALCASVLDSLLHKYIHTYIRMYTLKWHYLTRAFITDSLAVLCRRQLLLDECWLWKDCRQMVVSRLTCKLTW